MQKISLLLLFSFSSLAMSSAQTSSKQGSTGTKQDVFTIVYDDYEPYFFMRNARDIVCKKWGIQFHYFWKHNSVFLQSAETDSLHKQIHITDSVAKARFGSKWKSKFDKDLERELKIERKIKKLLLNSKIITEKNVKIDGEVDYYLDATDSPCVYHVNAYSSWPDKTARVVWDRASYYRASVNYKNKTVRVLSDSIMSYR